MKQVVVTKEGLTKIQKELDKLKNVDRPRVIERIREARSLGDLAENADYEDARNEQSFIEGRIEELESAIKHARVIEHASKDVVEVGANINITGETGLRTFSIVGAAEADPTQGRISDVSPLGQALLGHRAGDQVKVKTPKGEMTYTILSVK